MAKLSERDLGRKYIDSLHTELLDSPSVFGGMTLGIMLAQHFPEYTAKMQESLSGLFTGSTGIWAVETLIKLMKDVPLDD